jgi:hypothetical protein
VARYHLNTGSLFFDFRKGIVVRSVNGWNKKECKEKYLENL